MGDLSFDHKAAQSILREELEMARQLISTTSVPMGRMRVGELSPAFTWRRTKAEVFCTDIVLSVCWKRGAKQARLLAHSVQSYTNG